MLNSSSIIILLNLLDAPSTKQKSIKNCLVSLKTLPTSITEKKSYNQDFNEDEK